MTISGNLTVSGVSQVNGGTIAAAGGVTWTANPTGNTATLEVSLEMKNRENSSFLELLKLFDEIYVLNKFKY